MKIQNLAVMFIIIILPISMVLNAYTQNHIKTLSLQTSYDSKLNNATADALKAFQLNTFNSDTSDLANSKLRDIEASVNSFFNSISNNFNMVGYNQDILSEYVPALVYTMYDGFYIYSPYVNTLDNTNKNIVVVDEETNRTEEKSDAEVLDPNNNQDAIYKEGERLKGLKPYIHYSCRYKKGYNSDFVITYSLDNYITITGIVNGSMVYDYGYLLNPDEIEATTSNDEIAKLKYRNSDINVSDKVEEYVYEQSRDSINEYECIKLNGVKYYKDRTYKDCFSMMNGERIYQGKFDETNKTSAAVEYYKDAYNFTKRLLSNNTYTDIYGQVKNDGYGLGDLKSTDVVNEEGENFELEEASYEIFDTNTNLEEPNSNFNQHRLAIIRYCIEKNLAIAIANYNNYSGVTADFRMPKLQENEWDKIINNVSIISFLQGLNIGGKIYNGYSIITNNKNQEVVQEDSIYMVTNGGTYYRANAKDLVGNGHIKQGLLNIDFERRTSFASDGSNRYFYPHTESGSYSSIVNQTNVEVTDNMYEYMESKGGKLASEYFTALGRERYGSYKTNNDYNVLKEKFGITNN